MEKRKKIKRKKVVVEVDWPHYFASIQSVCPWSQGYWQKGSIDIVTSQLNFGRIEPQPLNTFVARIYIRPNSSPRLLNKLADRFNDRYEEEEWLWSHPRYQGHSTPVPVLIQQDRAVLEKARSKRKE